MHRPNAASIADKMLFMVASMAAEMERDLIRERTLDGLAAAEAQGRKGGRPPALDPDTLAVALARRARGESVTAIAAHLKIGRSTLYRALHPDQISVLADAAPPTAVPPAVAVNAAWRPVRARIRHPDEPVSPAERELRDRLVGQSETTRALACPTCGHEPVDVQARRRQRQDLEITWLSPDPASQLRVIERVHCASCQPHQQVATVLCQLCGSGPLLAGDLADAASDELPPAVVRTWLTQTGWQITPRLVCPAHPQPHKPDRGAPPSHSSSSGSSGASGSRSGRRRTPGAGR